MMTAGQEMVHAILNLISQDDSVSFIGNLAKSQNQLQSFSKYASHYPGYIIYLCIGIVFIIGMAIWFGFYCYCGREFRRKVRKGNIHFFVTFNLSFVIILSGTIIAFINTITFYTSLTSKRENKNVIKQFIIGLVLMTQSLDTMLSQISTALSGETFLDIGKSMKSMENDFLNKPVFSELAGVMDELKDLKAKQDNLSIPSNFTIISDSLISDVDKVRKSMVGLEVNVNFSNFNENMDLGNYFTLINESLSSFKVYLAIPINLMSKKTTVKWIQTIADNQLGTFLPICMILVVVLTLYATGMVLTLIKKTTKIGRRILAAGIITTFIFSPLFMLITTLLFITGGTLYTNVCRPLTVTSQYYQLDYITNSLNTNSSINEIIKNPISNLLLKCPSQSIGQALDINANKMIETLEMSDIFGELKSTLNTTLNDFFDKITDDVGEITEKVASINVTEGFNGPPPILKFSQDVKKFKQNAGTVLFKVLETFNNSRSTFKQSLYNKIDQILPGMIKSLLEQVECKQFVVAFNKVTYSLCSVLLGSVNGTWCGLGIFLIFNILTIITGIYISNMMKFKVGTHLFSNDKA